MARTGHAHGRTLPAEIDHQLNQLELFRQPGYYLMNGRIAYAFPDDRVEIGVSGFNITNQRVKIHPFAQTLTARFMGTISARF